MAHTEIKPPKKAIAVPSEESEDESDDEALGLLDKPVEIIETRRERKKVERLSLSIDTAGKKKEGLDYSKGRGLKLGDIEIVRYELNRSLAAELKPLHKLLYKTFGRPSTIKKNIYAFCGFPFEKDSKEYADLDWQMERFAKIGLLRLCEIFGLSLKGNRDELKAKVLEFLMEPRQTEKKVPVKATPTKSKSRKRKSEPSDQKPQKKKKVENKDKDDSDGDEEDAENEEKEDEVKEKKKKKEEKPKKKEKKTKPKKATVIKLPTPSKKKKEKVKEEKAKKKKASAKSKKTASDSEEDEPLSKIPRGPSDDEIEKVVQELLDGADLETVTMKMICKQVFDKFPNHDLTERKSFIKETVKQIIS